MSIKHIVGFFALLAVFFGSWMFAWPIVDSMFQAGFGFWDYMVENYINIPHKLGVFFLGFLLFIGGAISGINVVFKR